MNSRGGICIEKPRFDSAGRRGVTGWGVGMLVSSFEVRREASMCGEGDKREGVPPPSDMDLVFVKGDRPWVRAMSTAACSSGALTSSMMADSSYSPVRF